MISAFANTWRVPELRKRILFTLVMILFVRLGVHIPLPGIDLVTLKAYIDSQINTGGNTPAEAMGALMRVFSGGGLQQLGIFALGIMPYISASIMVQLLTAVVPKWQKLSREEGGRQKITQYTRLLTIGLAIVQTVMLISQLENPGQGNPLFPGLNRSLVLNPGWEFTLTAVTIVTAGTMLLCWMGDQITDKGIGNGTSLIIGVNILSGLPAAMSITWTSLVYENGVLNPMGALKLVALIAFLIAIIAALVTITQAQRRIAIQYAKRVGTKMAQGATQYLPLKLNYAGVMPVIFASALFMLPATLIGWIVSPDSPARSIVQEVLSPMSPWYYLISSTVIFFFSYFWVATMFQPQQIAEDLKRSGGYIPGIRPGKPTSDFLDFTMNRLTFVGAASLTLIYFIPYLVQFSMNLPAVAGQFFGGTSLLILVGVLLDSMRQVETSLLQRNYDGFLRKAKSRTDRYSKLPAQASSSNTMVWVWILVAVVTLGGVLYFMQ